MSELIQKHDNRATIRWKLLTGASALALAAYVSSAAMAKAEDASRPLVWIDLGGQFERQSGLGHTYTPFFMVNYADSPAFNPVSPLHWEKPPIFSEGLEGAFSFQPEGSDWNFSASIRYGRSGGRKSAMPGREIDRPEHATYAPLGHKVNGVFVLTKPIKTATITETVANFAPVQADQKQTHDIIDFMAGKDVGLGLFGKDATGTLSAGVRIASFRSKTAATIHARPDGEFTYISFGKIAHNIDHIYPSLPFLFPRLPYFHTYAAQFQADRQFHGVGPSISWSASLPVAGNPSDETLTIDWGINAAVLFGRQQASGNHQTSGHYVKNNKRANYVSAGGIPFTRSRNVTVPNVGGMLGMSVKFPNAKISIGYRGDFFFGAMDTGVDTRKTGTTGFYGPFASISVGIGN
jgi:hypothetical protein